MKQYKHLHSLLDEYDWHGDQICDAESQIDADYIMRLGAPADLVTVTGNTKFDQTYTDVSIEENDRLSRIWDWPIMRVSY